MNINAAVTTHKMLASTVERTIQGIRMFYDTDIEMALELMRPIIVLGKPGIGKTVALRELAQKKLKIGYKELRLASMSELDLAGLPMVKEDEDGVSETTYAASKLLPKASRDGEYGILVLDEISSCSRAARAVALQLLDSSRGVGEYKLPDKWICVGLGNDAEDGGIFEGLEGAFLNRCRCIRLEPDLDSWVAWADSRGLNTTVMAFLKCYPDLFYVDPVEGDTRICASPRAWQGVATQLDFAEKLAGGRIDASQTEMFLASIASDVTPDIAARLAAFYAYNAEIINPEDILSGKAKLNGKDAGAKESIYLTIESCIALLIKRTKGVEVSKMSADLQTQIANFIRFTGMLQTAKGGEAAVTALEQLLNRVPVSAALLTIPTFKKTYPDEYRILVGTASKLTGIARY